MSRDYSIAKQKDDIHIWVINYLENIDPQERLRILQKLSQSIVELNPEERKKVIDAGIKDSDFRIRCETCYFIKQTKDPYYLVFLVRVRNKDNRVEVRDEAEKAILELKKEQDIIVLENYYSPEMEILQRSYHNYSMALNNSIAVMTGICINLLTNLTNKIYSILLLFIVTIIILFFWWKISCLSRNINLKSRTYLNKRDLSLTSFYPEETSYVPVRRK